MLENPKTYTNVHHNYTKLTPTFQKCLLGVFLRCPRNSLEQAFLKCRCQFSVIVVYVGVSCWVKSVKTIDYNKI